ncbi:MAG: iron-sulfur cluster assembly accessory protein [Candidatus Thiodiazotropha sp. (ex Troendleina suluensis)]|nr:iron-sulfur cluster assembly accessory protein [Candidatus Thiodiazotropha sp. (ex Troendleina suluensis)]
MAIQLTESATRHVKSMLANKTGSLGLRLGTRKSGCTGFAYVVDYTEEIEDEDLVFESHGVKLIVNSNSLPMLDGMTIDYVKMNMLNEGFDFINPNIKESCGCGESFSV